MSRAVHWLQPLTLVTIVYHVHVIFVILVVAGGLPQIQIKQIRSDNLLVFMNSIETSHVVHQLIVNFSSVG